MANLKYKKDDSWVSISAVRGPKGDNADITLNGQTSQNVSFYAPIEGGSIGQYLSANGDGKTPEWKDLALPIVGNGTLTIQKNGTSVGTFSANTSSNQSVNIEVPTNQNIIDLIYPIGSVYRSTVNADPSLLFGGSWKQYAIESRVDGEVVSSEATNSWTTNASVTVPAGRWLLIGGAHSSGAGTGFTLRLSSSGSYDRQSIHCSDSNTYSGQVMGVVEVTSPTTYLLQSWSATARTLGAIIITAHNLNDCSSYGWERIG